MVIEIEQTEEEIEEEKSKLVVICKMCDNNFNPEPLECPYIYHPEMGVHIPLCPKCRTDLKGDLKSSLGVC